jgi:very-short-patch-repair endonuclease
VTDPKEKIAAWMREQYDGQIWVLLSMSPGDSPIENVLFLALSAWFSASGGEQYFRRLGYVTKGYDKNDPWFFWQSQFQVENYRVDFVFCMEEEEGKPKGSTLVVECDGHDFHERTKAQAASDRARDRTLQELGFTIYRFTGSEIYRDPMKCAEQILRWAGFVE